MRFEHYQTGVFFDEMFEAGCEPRTAARALVQLIETMTDGELLRRQQSARTPAHGHYVQRVRRRRRH
jgi:hypothetical protein